MSRNQITKELAERIIAKLGAVKVDSGAHIEYVVSYEGESIATLRLRHSSQKNKGHDYIPGELHVGPNFAKQLGQCPKSKEDYFAHLRKIGLLPDDGNDAADQE